MAPPESRQVHVPLMVAPLCTRAPFPEGAVCLGCGSPLTLHQPVDDDPLRLLGTCDLCGRWHLIDRDRAAVALLPDAAAFCDAEAVR